MKHQPYLTENGIRIFNEILKYIEGKNLEEKIDSYELSMLSNAFDLHERAAMVMNNSEGGFTQTTKNNYSQIRAEFTAWQKTGEMINKLSEKFGLSPAAREKMKAFTKKGKAAMLPVSGQDKIRKYQ